MEDVKQTPSSLFRPAYGTLYETHWEKNIVYSTL